MAEPDLQLREVYVQPGESHLVQQPAMLRTVLGSCVGVTFLVPRLGCGALCHPMMPRCPPALWAGQDVHAARRYVDFALREMASRLDRLGAKRSEVIVSTRLANAIPARPCGGASRHIAAGNKGISRVKWFSPMRRSRACATAFFRTSAPSCA